MSDPKAKQKIIDKLKDVDTVLVTVSSNPSVDELSAALGFTLLINKLNKHGTAIFSGDIPPAITFLDPEKTFENTVDSLRDFIIALDKEKADHLRYKVVDDMVKIFITPYRTKISQDDFDFSQGDYNVEMVVAIGVHDDDDLDRALTEHGRILHDATVVSITAGSDKSELGTISWHDDDASSYSEMLVSLSEGVRNDKKMIDEQIATAFLTGIVAATERFSNSRTNSNVMTMAAQLMAAGANQQLIATKLEEAEEIEDVSVKEPEPKKEAPKPKKKAKAANTDDEPVKDKPAADGTMTISHTPKGDVDAVADQVEKNRQEAARKSAEDILAEGLAKTQKEDDKPSVADLQKDIKAASSDVDEALDTKPSVPDAPVLPPPVTQNVQTPHDAEIEPTMGGTLNATTEQAAEDKRRQMADDRNKTILSHDSGKYLDDGATATGAPINSYDKPANMTEPGQQPDPSAQAFSSHGKDISPITSPHTPTLAEIDAQNRTPHADPRAAIDAALNEGPSTAQQQQSIPTDSQQIDDHVQQHGGVVPPMPAGLPPMPPMPPMPDFSQLPPMPGQATGVSPQQSQGGITPPAPQSASALPTPVAPPTPQTPQQAQEDLSSRLGDILPPAQPQAPSAPDPSQFRIPGQ